MIIRKAVLRDVDSILPHWIQLMKLHAEWHPTFKLIDNFEVAVREIISDFLQKPNRAFFVAELDQGIHGFMQVHLSTKPPVFEKTKKGVISDVYVSQEYRKKGVGKKLIEESFKWFKEQNVDFIDLHVARQNPGAKEFWEKCGFDIVSYHMVKM